MTRQAPRRGRTSNLFIGLAMLGLGIVNIAQGSTWLGTGFAAIGLAALLGSPEAHALLGVDYSRRWTPLRILALALVVLSLGAFVVLVVRGLS
jgi:hypothetical protein